MDSYREKYTLGPMSCGQCYVENEGGSTECKKCLYSFFPNVNDDRLEYMKEKKELETEKNTAIDMGVYDIGQAEGELNFGGEDFFELLTFPTLERTCTRYDCRCHEKGLEICQTYKM